jgi:signal transduction histidine kinase
VQKLSSVPPASREAETARTAIADEIGTTVAIFDALLDIATTEAEAGDQTRLKTVDLGQVVESVVDLYDAVAEERGIALVVDAKGRAEMLGDSGLLTRMLANVVDNAIKFSPAGGRVAITLATRGRSHVLTVTDSGPGLLPDIRDRAFERFTRGAATSSVPGHGLGLAVVKAIAVRHGIRIGLADARPGLAVTFTCPALAE